MVDVRVVGRVGLVLDDLLEALDVLLERRDLLAAVLLGLLQLVEVLARTNDFALL